MYNRVALIATADYDRVSADTVPVTLVATVTNDDGEALPEDLTVTFHDGETELGHATVTNGVATFTTEVANTKQTHSFSATSADHITDSAHFNTATGKAELSITPVAKTHVELGLNTDAAPLGAPLTLEATYTATSGTVAGVDIVFRRDGVRIGTATTGQDGIARLEYQLTQSGTHDFTAFVPERTDEERRYTSADSERHTVTVAEAQAHTSSTTLTRTQPTSESDVVTGTEVEFSAAIATDGDIVDGTVSFYANDALLGTVAVDPESATATLRHAFSTPGDVAIRAMFNGSAKKNGDVTTQTVASSESDELTLTIAPRTITVPGGGNNDGNTDDTEDNTGSTGKDSFLQKIRDFFTQGPLAAIFSSIVSAISSFFAGFSSS